VRQRFLRKIGQQYGLKSSRQKTCAAMVDQKAMSAILQYSNSEDYGDVELSPLESLNLLAQRQRADEKLWAEDCGVFILQNSLRNLHWLIEFFYSKEIQANTKNARQTN